MAPNRELNVRLQREFGALLRNARRRAQKGQKQLAAVLRLTRTSVSNMERGKHRIYLDQVYEAARFLRVDIAQLLPPLSSVLSDHELHEASDDPLTLKAREVFRLTVEQVRGETPPKKRTSAR